MPKQHPDIAADLHELQRITTIEHLIRAGLLLPPEMRVDVCCYAAWVLDADLLAALHAADYFDPPPPGVAHWCGWWGWNPADEPEYLNALAKAATTNERTLT